jgi:hypothetical protein
MTTGRNIREAIEAWRAVDASEREHVFGEIEDAAKRDISDGGWWKAIALLRAVAEPEAESTVGGSVDVSGPPVGSSELRWPAEPEAKAVPIERATEKCVWCKHMEPHTLRDDKHGRRGCSAHGCDCEAYESRIRP